jgi:hypothetical protein
MYSPYPAVSGVAAFGRCFANTGVEWTKLPLEGFGNLLEWLVCRQTNVVHCETSVVHRILPRAQYSRLSRQKDAAQDDPGQHHGADQRLPAPLSCHLFSTLKLDNAGRIYVEWRTSCSFIHVLAARATSLPLSGKIEITIDPKYDENYVDLHLTACELRKLARDLNELSDSRSSSFGTSISAG